MNPPSNDPFEGGFCNGAFDCLLVKARIYRVEILRVHAVLSKTEGVGEATTGEWILHIHYNYDTRTNYFCSKQAQVFYGDQ